MACGVRLVAHWRLEGSTAMKIASGFAVAGLALFLTLRPAHAVIFECPTCSQAWQTAVEIGKQAEEIAEVVQTKLNTFYTFQNMVSMAERLPQTVYQTVTGPVRMITGMGSQMRYGGGFSVPSLMAPVTSVTSYVGLLDQQTRQIGYSFEQLKSIFSTHDDQMQSSVKNLEDLEGQARGLDGRNQILQTMAGIEAVKGQSDIAYQATQSAVSQAMLQTMAAQQQRESYVVALTDKHETAGIQSMCAAAAQTGLNFSNPACR